MVRSNGAILITNIFTMFTVINELISLPVIQMFNVTTKTCQSTYLKIIHNRDIENYANSLGNFVFV